MMFTDDPIHDFYRHNEKEQKWLESRPTCEWCGEPIQTEKAFYDDHIGYLCDKCIEGAKVSIDE